MHSARIACELGADIIKTKYTGDIELFQKVVNSCSGTPIIIAGGIDEAEDVVLEKTRSAIDAGASGVCYGRNVYNRENVSEFIEKIKNIVYV